MKKYLILGVAAVLTFTALKAGAYISLPYGSRDVNRPDVEDILVKNGDSQTWTIGTLVGLSSVAADGVTGRIVTGTDGLPALCVTNEAIAASAFGRCRKRGYHSAVRVDGTTATVALAAVVASSTAGHIEGGLGSGEVPLGIALEAASTSTTQKVYLQIP